MHSFISQDLVTIRGSSSTTTITQSEHAWLELPEYPNAVAWLDVREITTGGGTVQIAYQTAPTADESLFVPLYGPSTLTLPFTPSLGITVSPLLKDLLYAPLARWFRWQLTASGTTSSWDITFRLFVAAHRAKAKHNSRK